jgi:beta-lactamase class A
VTVENDWTSIDALAADTEGTGGVVGVAVFSGGHTLYGRHGGRRFRAASTVKAPIMIAAYRQIERGEIALDERHVLREEEYTPGSGVLSYLHAGLELTFADLLYLMIAVSDNTATNLVLDRVGFDAVNATMQSLGMDDSSLGRRMLGRLPEEGSPDNWTTPRDLAWAVQAIVSGEAAGPQSCARMLETLEQQTRTQRIGRFLREDEGIRWGSKPGSLPGIHNDAGFVTTARGTLCLAVCCEDLPDLDAAERTIGKIAQAALALTGFAANPS